MPGLKRWPSAGRVRPVDAVAVALARADERQVAVPVERRALVQLDALLGAVLVEQAQLDARGVLGEDREVRAAAVPVRAERERVAGPDLAALTGPPPRRAGAARRRGRRRRPAPARRPAATARRRSWRGCGTGRARTVSRRPSARAVGLGAVGAQLGAQRERVAVERAQPGGLARGGSAWSARTSPGPGDRGFPHRTPRTPRTRGAGPRGSPSAISASMWSEKNWNGATLAVFLALEEHRRERCQTREQRGERPRLDGGRRSPKARLPTWSWSEEKTTKRSGATSSAGAPKRRPRKLEYVPSWTCGRCERLGERAEVARTPRTSRRSRR